MRRQREQSGSVYKRGGFWVLRYRQTINQRGELKTVQRGERLIEHTGEYKSKHSAALKELVKQKLASINQWNKTPERVTTLGDFIEGVYLPFVQENKKASTYKGYKDIWEDHLKPRCESVLLRSVKTCDVQMLLDQVAKQDGLSKNSLKNTKHFLGGVFTLAINRDYFDSRIPNPVHSVFVPAHAPKAKERHAYSLSEVINMLVRVPEPARTMIGVACFSGLRKSEIWGLQWTDYTPSHVDQSGQFQAATLQIRRSIVLGVEGDPKTEKSAATIPVISPLAKMLDAHRLLNGNPQDGWMFKNGNGNPLDPDSAYRQFVKDVNGIEWHGWHAGRHGLGTILYELGIDAKTRQTILRHSNVQTTEDIYTHRVDQKVIDAMRQFENILENSLSCAYRALAETDRVTVN